MRRSLLALAALCALAVAGAAAPPSPTLPRAQRARVLMGTLCTVEAEAADTTTAATAAAAALDTIARLEDVMSSWRGTSELSALNRGAAAHPFPCSPDLYAVLDSALAAARETGGAFDPTVEALDLAWDLRGKGRVPTAMELAAARARAGFAALGLDPVARTAAFARPGVGVDLGGIGKGYALDRAADALRAQGVRTALLNLGGQLLALGDGPPQTVTLADPSDRLRPAITLRLARASLSVSGQGEHFVVVHGRRYGHILDPRTGLPLSTRASVAVIAPSATRADGLSTALLVMGRARARAFVRARPELGAVWLERHGERVFAWRWNVPGAAAAPGARIAWQP